MRTLVLGVLLAGCYVPRGPFVSVDDTMFHGVGDYQIMPGDLIEVRVFRQEAMSARVRVRVDGKVSLPMINDVLAAGKTPTTLATELQFRLRDFINMPVVTVLVEESRPVSVSVLGEVVRPGMVTLDQSTGVLHALAAAGGLNDFAHRDGIFVLRRVVGAPAPQRVRFTWDALTQGTGNAPRFTLVTGDIVVVE